MREDLKDMLAPIIRLQPLTMRSCWCSSKAHADYAGYFGWTPTLTENDLVDFLKIEFGRVGADTAPDAREVIRDFIELLDILCQNPDADVAELLQSVGGDTLAPANDAHIIRRSQLRRIHHLTCQKGQVYFDRFYLGKRRDSNVASHCPPR
ncbi:MAG: BREX system ATP-binding domain-containing protein [Collinsella sp.]